MNTVRCDLEYTRGAREKQSLQEEVGIDDVVEKLHEDRQKSETSENAGKGRNDPMDI
jgi:hypothetical protein